MDKEIFCDINFFVHYSLLPCRSVASHQISYLVLALLAFLSFAATFAEILLLDRYTACISHLFFLDLVLIPDRGEWFSIPLIVIAGCLRLGSSFYALHLFSLASIHSSWLPSSTGASDPSSSILKWLFSDGSATLWWEGRPLCRCFTRGLDTALSSSYYLYFLCDVVNWPFSLSWRFLSV